MRKARVGGARVELDGSSQVERPCDYPRDAVHTSRPHVCFSRRWFFPPSVERNVAKRTLVRFETSVSVEEDRFSPWRDRWMSVSLLGPIYFSQRTWKLFLLREVTQEHVCRHDRGT